MDETITVELPVNIVRAWLKNPLDQRALNKIKKAIHDELAKKAK